MSQIVRYSTQDGAEVQFEIEPVDGFQAVGAAEVIGHVREAVQPAVDAAAEVLDRAKALRPDRVEVRFGIKVSGAANWVVAKAATEGNFEVTMTWQTAGSSKPEHGADPDSVPEEGRE